MGTVIRPASDSIHLDTSFLIRALGRTSPEASQMATWLEEHRSIVVSTLTWSEFVCGPIREHDERVAKRLLSRHIPVGTEQASLAARLFNLGGQRRHSLPDCVIAATAILAGAVLATANPRDFERFTDAGLVLAE